MFPTRKPVSEFTERALHGHVKEVAMLTGMSKTDLYAILASERADHLDYARDMHRALCRCNPPAADEFRALLEADRDYIMQRQPPACVKTLAGHVAREFTDTVKAELDELPLDERLREAVELKRAVDVYVDALLRQSLDGSVEVVLEHQVSS